MRSIKLFGRTISALVLIFMLIGGGAIASIVVWFNLSEPIEVLEPFSVTSTIPPGFSLYAGETVSYSITVSNAANVAIMATVDYSENPDYDEDGTNVDMDISVSPSMSQIVPPESSVTFNIDVTVAADSKTGEVSITWNVERGSE